MALIDLHASPRIVHANDPGHAGEVLICTNSQVWRMSLADAITLRDRLTVFFGSGTPDPAVSVLVPDDDDDPETDFLASRAEAPDDKAAAKARRRQDRHEAEMAQDMTPAQHRRAAALYQARSVLESTGPLSTRSAPRPVGDFLALASYVENGAEPARIGHSGLALAYGDLLPADDDDDQD